MTELDKTKYINTANKYIRECLPYAKTPSESLGRVVMTKQEERRNPRIVLF